MNLHTWIAKENLTQGEFAEALGVSAQAVNRWLLDYTQIAPQNIWTVYEVTNGEVLPHEIRPDLYPVEKMKKIYGCLRCREQTPNDYQKWFYLLEESTLDGMKYQSPEQKRLKVARLKERNSHIESQGNV